MPMPKMVINDQDILVQDVPKGHKGFYDNEWRRIFPGDIVALRNSKSVYLVMLTRFTKTTVVGQPLYIAEGSKSQEIKCYKYHYDKPRSDGTIMMRGVVKVEGKV